MTKKTTPAPSDWLRLADHPKYGRVFVSTTTPDRDGCIRVMRPATDRPELLWYRCHPQDLTYIDTEPEANQ